MICALRGSWFWTARGNHRAVEAGPCPPATQQLAEGAAGLGQGDSALGDGAAPPSVASAKLGLQGQLAPWAQNTTLTVGH